MVIGVLAAFMGVMVVQVVSSIDSVIAFIAQVFGKNSQGSDVLEKELIQFRACVRCKHYRPQMGMSICHLCMQALNLRPPTPPLNPGPEAG